MCSRGMDRKKRRFGKFCVLELRFSVQFAFGDVGLNGVMVCWFLCGLHGIRMLATRTFGRETENMFLVHTR